MKQIWNCRNQKRGGLSVRLWHRSDLTDESILISWSNLKGNLMDFKEKRNLMESMFLDIPQV